MFLFVKGIHEIGSSPQERKKEKVVEPFFGRVRAKLYGWFFLKRSLTASEYELIQKIRLLEKEIVTLKEDKEILLSTQKELNLKIQVLQSSVTILKHENQMLSELVHRDLAAIQAQTVEQQRKIAKATHKPLDSFDEEDD